MINFSHLHVHSTYSLLDGMASVEGLVSRAKELGQPALAITDHGSTSALWELQKEAKKQGIKPILGTEFYYKRENDDKNGHLVVLAKNNVGLRNIFKLQEYAYVENFYRKPRIDFETLVQFKEGLIVLSACLASTFCQYLMDDEEYYAIEWASKFKEEFGDDFYLEIQPNNIPEQWMVNKRTIAIADKLGIKVVATNDVHYTLEEDHFAHEVLLAMQTKKKISDENRFKFTTQDFWLKSTDEMIETFIELDESDVISALEITQEIVDKCNAEIKPGRYLPSYYDVPEGYTSRQLLAERLMEGAKNKGHHKDKEYMKEVQYELDIVDEEGYSDYFLIVQDYVTSARNRGETVGDGRGSAAGAKISYLLDITRLEPKKHNLLFERFMAKNREPDVDCDFSDQEAVFADLQKKYGEGSVARIVAFGTLTPKAVTRKVFSTFDYNTKEINRICKLIPEGLRTMEEVYNSSPEVLKLKEQYPLEFSVIEKLEGLVSHESQHAGGVVIYPNLSDYLPIKSNSDNRNDRIVAFDMDMLHELHFFKFDILGLETIGVIKDTLDSIKELTGKEVDLYSIDYDDENVYNMLSKGDVSGVFQLANQAQKVMEQKPKNFKDLIAINAIIRPGTCDFDEYLARRNGKEWSVHPDRLYYMEETSGLMVYQEQFLLDAKVFAGWDIAYADKHIRKNKNIMEDYELRDKFYKDSLNRGYKKEDIVVVWDEITNSVANGYNFNKAHSTSYAMTSFQTAWLKYYYPEHFYAALMSREDGQAEISNYVSECKQRGINILPPDINVSNHKFVVTDEGIRYRITAITHVGKSAIKAIEKMRPIKSFEDFMNRRVRKDIKSNTLENLIKAGCFDCFEENRALLLSSVKDEVYPWNESIKLIWEKEVLGLYLSSHPMEKYGFYPLDKYSDREEALQGGEIAEVIEVLDKNNNEMAFITLDTLYGMLKVIIFSSVWSDKEIQNMCRVGQVVLIKGRRSGNSLLLNSMEVLE